MLVKYVKFDDKFEFVDIEIHQRIVIYKTQKTVLVDIKLSLFHCSFITVKQCGTQRTFVIVNEFFTDMRFTKGQNTTIISRSYITFRGLKALSRNLTFTVEESVPVVFHLGLTRIAAKGFWTVQFLKLQRSFLRLTVEL